MSASQILVVEDESIVATAIKNELENFGYDISGVVSSAMEAVEKAVRDKPDLVLMDIHLKGEIDGIDAGREIHTRCGIPVVYLSAFADPETVARARETGAFGYLLKPYDERELQTTIEMALAKHCAEQRLEETERWLAAVLEGIDDAVIATDPDSQIHYMNLAAEALTGWRKQNAVKAPFAAACNLIEERGRIVLEDLAERAVCESRLVELPAMSRLVARNGQEIPVEGHLAPIYDSRGEFLGMVLTLRNISARMELERVRRQSEEQTRQSQNIEAVRRLAGGIAHHLNNLLTVILGNTSLALLRPFYEDAISEALDRVETAGHRAADLTQRLLIFSGCSRGQLQQIDLNSLIPECLNEIKPLLNARINVAYRPGSELWPVTADAMQLGQVLLNLCLNAQDAMADGGQLTLETKNVAIVEADLSQHPGGRAGDFVRVTVSDTGRGMTPAVRAQLFEPFFTTKEPDEGIGLGLAFVFAVVEQHHGWIECSSQVSRGTRFDLYLPRYGVGAVPNLVEIHQQKPRGARPTILLADSDPMVRDIGRRLLEGQGYRVLLAESGLQAVETFRQAPERIDLVIADLNMPQLTGNAILERLMELDPNVRVLFSSGYFAEDLSEGEGHTLGVISKPYRHKELIEMVRRIVAEISNEERAPSGECVAVARAHTEVQSPH